MKLIFDLNKSAMGGKVQVQRTVTRNGATFQQHFWVNPSDVKDTDVVIGGQKSQNHLEISEKNFPVGSKLYYKGEEATVERVGKEFSGGGMGIVVRFSKGGTGTIGKSDMKNVSKTPPAKSSADSKEEFKVGQRVTYNGKRYKIDSIKGNKVTMTCRSTDMYSVDDPRYKNGDETRTVDKSELTTKGSNSDKAEPKKPDTGKTGKATSTSSAGSGSSNHITGKNMTELVSNLKAQGYEMDAADKRQPQDKVTLFKDGKTYSATFNKYSDGGVEVLNLKEKTSVTNFKNGFVRYNPDGETPPYHGGKTYKYFASRKDDTTGKYFDTKEEAEDYVKGGDTSSDKFDNTKALSGKNVKFTAATSGRWESDKQSVDAAMIKPNGDLVSSKSSKYVIIKNGDKYKLYEVGLNRKSHLKTAKSLDEAVKFADAQEDKADTKPANKPTKARKVSNMDDLQNGIKSINRAIGKEHNIFNAVSVMGGGKLGEQLAYVSIPKLQTESNAKKVIDEQLKREFGDSVKYSLTKESDHFVVSMKLDDNKTSGSSTGKSVDQSKSDNSASDSKFDASEFTKLKSDRPKALQYLKDNGISWKETDNEGINWMRACMAASKAENSAQGTTKKDDASKSSTDSKPAGKSPEEAKKAVKDLLSAHGNDRAKVMSAAKASGVTWKESDNDGINWMRASLAIQKHHESGKTISAAKADDKKTDADSKPTHDKPLVTTDTKSGRPYQIWESNGRIYGSLPGKQDSRNVRDIRDFTNSGFDTLEEVKDYIKKYF